MKDLDLFRSCLNIIQSATFPSINFKGMNAIVSTAMNLQLRIKELSEPPMQPISNPISEPKVDGPKKAGKK